MMKLITDDQSVNDQSSDEGADDSTVHSSHNEETVAKIGRAENTVVWKLKAVVVLVVLCATIATALSVFLYTTRSEQSQFEEQFLEYSDKVLDSIVSSLDQTFGAMDSLATDVVAYAKSTSQTWPFVTIPFFGNRAAKILSISSPVILSILPLITNETRLEWEAYSKLHGREWVDEYLHLQKSDIHFPGPIIEDYNTTDIIHDDYGNVPHNTSQEFFFPAWHTYPAVPRYSPYNWDYYPIADIELLDMIEHKSVVTSQPYHLPDLDDPEAVFESEISADFFLDYIPPSDDPAEPALDIQFPLLDTLDTVKPDAEKANLVGSLTSSIYFRDIVRNILPPGSSGIVLVVENGCAPTFSYLVTETTQYLGQGDHHSRHFDDLGVHSTLADARKFASTNSFYVGPDMYLESCPFVFHLYPSNALEGDYITNMPMIFTIGAVGIFVMCAVIFLIYDRSVERRQNVVLTNATKSNAVVASLFPAEVRDRLYDNEDPQSENANANKRAGFFSTSNEKANKVLASAQMKSTETLSFSNNFEGNPIAQLYPETTVMFADISGFTAWSSVREPYQVFRLLESLYSAFDQLAREYKVFKVETIGDSYVAVCGLPRPKKNHAVVMSRFASACREKSSILFRELDSTLGPGTADLSIRFGLHSGPTTAGILRGDKSRFQLFGDTVNTAARMESTGQRGRIQVTQKTADLLYMAGKTTWIKKRDTVVEAKGKGALQTYWVDPATSGTVITSSSTGTSPSSAFPTSLKKSAEDIMLDEESLRMVDWYVENLAELLQQVVPSSSPSCSRHKTESSAPKFPRDQISDTVLIKVDKSRENNDLSETVMKQLYSYVSTIALMYNDNPFHNFHHATHVGMSARRYMRHLNVRNNKSPLSSPLTNDPLVQFAALFSTLIHDVDHAGCPNATLIEEGSQIATLYNGKSVAEQNSIDLAWDLLTGSNGDFTDLCDRIYNMDGFRQLVVNLVMATDIFDPELKAWRQSRQHENDDAIQPATFSTLVMEQLLQVADVSHTMQHWSIFLKWNRSLFDETMKVYESGRGVSGMGNAKTPKQDPSVHWYAGEIGFFDKYIIPMAENLYDQRMIGLDSVEFAKSNRNEWERKGRSLVQTWVEARQKVN